MGEIIYISFARNQFPNDHEPNALEPVMIQELITLEPVMIQELIALEPVMIQELIALEPVMIPLQSNLLTFAKQLANIFPLTELIAC